VVNNNTQISKNYTNSFPSDMDILRSDISEIGENLEL